MGYSITIKVRSVALGNEMIKFLRKHGHTFGQVLGQAQNASDEFYHGPFWADGKGDDESKERGGLSYCHRKGHIGFDYGQHREYLYVLLKWMAQKIGQKSREKIRYLYDGHEWIDIDSASTGPLGLPTEEVLARDEMAGAYWKLWDNYVQSQGKTCIDMLREEMQRLDDLWEKR